MPTWDARDLDQRFTPNTHVNLELTMDLNVKDKLFSFYSNKIGEYPRLWVGKDCLRSTEKVLL